MRLSVRKNNVPSLMKRILFCLIIGFVCGCETARPPPGDVPLEVVLKIPARLQNLRPGMSEAAVLETLGLSRYSVVSFSSGPTKRMGYQLFLRPGYSLILTYDETQTPPAFLSADFFGDGSQQKKSN